MNEELKNIKPDVEIPVDFISYFVFALFVLIIIIVLVFLFFYFARQKKKPSGREKATIILKNLDLQNLPDKQIAYLFTKYGQLSLNPYYEDEFANIVRQLEEFKYKKNIPDIDEDLRDDIKEYIKVRI